MNTSVHDLIERSGFEEVRLLRSTSESECFVGKRVDDGQTCFVKCVNSARYLRELNALAVGDDSLCCLPQDHSFVDSDRCLLIFPWIRGGNLSRLMGLESARTSLNMRQLAVRIFESLRAVHAAGLVHGDIKPENFLIGEAVCPAASLKLSDFGSSAYLTELKARGWRAASPSYESPESVEGRASYASDLYSAGVVLYELLIGHRPFRGMPSEIYKQSRFELAPLNSIDDERLRCLLARLLSTDLSVRPRSATEVLEYLTRGFGSRVTTKTPPPNRLIPNLRLHGFVRVGNDRLSLISDERASLFCFFNRFQMRMIDSRGETVLEIDFQGPAPVWHRQYLWYWIGADLYRFDGYSRRREFVAHFKYPPDAFDIGPHGVVWISSGTLFSAGFDGRNLSFQRIYGYLSRNQLAVIERNIYIASGVSGSTLVNFSEDLELVGQFELGGVILDICRGRDNSVHILLESFEKSRSIRFIVLSADGRQQKESVSDGFTSVSLSHDGCVVWSGDRRFQVLENVNGKIVKSELNRRLSEYSETSS